MKITKNLSVIILSLLLLTVGMAAQRKNLKPIKKSVVKTAKPPAKKMNEKPSNDYKILVEGSYSKAMSPFVMIARDTETYALIKALVENLPESASVDFDKTAVIAAFAGEKNTGGYKVTISPSANKWMVDVSSPRKGDMTMQVITSPFQVVAVPVEKNQPVPLEIPAAWRQLMQTFRVSKADFLYSGGFAGRTKKFNAEGTIQILTHGELATCVFDLSGTGANHSMKLWDVASGTIKGEKLNLAHIDAGTFAEMPHPPLKAFGTATNNKLLISFESLMPMVSDGFMARGTLEAVKIK
jgi:hypothetical protein